MMLNSRFELSKIEKNTRVEREICLATLENREWKENLFLPLSKIESRKRNLSCHSRKSRVEREMETIKFSRSREKFLFLLSIFLSRARLSSMPDTNTKCLKDTTCAIFFKSWWFKDINYHHIIISIVRTIVLWMPLFLKSLHGDGCKIQ